MKLTIENWRIDFCTDDDGHLTLGINHTDGSQVMVINEDLSTNSSEWVDRFTTRRIEDTEADKLGIQRSCFSKPKVMWVNDCYSGHEELMGDMITECNVCGNKERHPMAWGHNCSSTKDCSGTQQMLNETEEEVK